jgi:hypothetical protein
MVRNPDEAQISAAVRHQSDDGLSPFRAIAESVSAEGGDLVERVSELIDQAQSFAATQVNATLTLRNWYIGRMIDVAVLHEDRAGHARELVASLAR